MTEIPTGLNNPQAEPRRVPSDADIAMLARSLGVRIKTNKGTLKLIRAVLAKNWR